MPFLVIGFAALIAGVVGFALNAMDDNRQRQKVLPPHVATAIGSAPERPPLAYRGDTVFCLRQQRWGKVETLARAAGAAGYVYGVRLMNGLGVVAREADMIG